MTANKGLVERVRSLPTWAIILICLVYIISPIDFVPDFIPVLGQGDDLIAFCLTVVEVVRRRQVATA
jgi:uncharacterized membrane protein YkvA (DUF1232 family)